MMAELEPGEVEEPNPGNTLCKVCRGLITSPTVIRYGCNVRCPKCRRRKTEVRVGGKRVSRKPPGKGWKHLSEDDR
jgi:Zn finger protein HypA/HybF involved in hydrogenase expression